MLMSDETVRLPPVLADLLEDAKNTCTPEVLGPRPCPSASIEQLTAAVSSPELMQQLSSFGMLTAHEVLLALASLPGVTVNNMQQQNAQASDPDDESSVDEAEGVEAREEGAGSSGDWDDVSPTAFLPVGIQVRVWKNQRITNGLEKHLTPHIAPEPHKIPTHSLI